MTRGKDSHTVARRGGSRSWRPYALCLPNEGKVRQARWTVTACACSCHPVLRRRMAMKSTYQANDKLDLSFTRVVDVPRGTGMACLDRTRAADALVLSAAVEDHRL